MALTALLLFVGLELKHYIADYALQPGWLLRGKGNLRAAGGYIHAGIHAVASGLVLALLGVPLFVVALVCGSEFVAHYAIDYVKYRWGSGFDAQTAPWRFWALHGLDQFMHQLTYAAMFFAALVTMPFH